MLPTRRMRLSPVLLVLAVAQPALADARLAFLSRQLSKASDPRARAQAALLLGSSGDPDALTPLCGGLADAQEIVRSASAKGLELLHEPGAADCLQRHGEDPNADVAASIKRALAALTAPPGKATLYVAIGTLMDKTPNANGSLSTLLESLVRGKLLALGAQVAPAGETKAQAQALIRSKKMKGFMLNLELHPHPPSGLRLTILCLTYPDRSILGEVSVKASGAGPQDLIRALAPKAIEEAADTFDWSR